MTRLCVEPVAHASHLVTADQQVAGIEEMNPVTAVSYAYALVSPDAVVDDLHTVGFVHPDAERTIAQRVVAQDGPGRRWLDVDAGVGRADVLSAALHDEALDAGAWRGHDERCAHAAAIDDTTPAPKNQGLVDANRALVAAGSELDYVARRGAVEYRQQALPVVLDPYQLGLCRADRRHRYQEADDERCALEDSPPHTSAA
jgi:hypothetical protein